MWGDASCQLEVVHTTQPDLTSCTPGAIEGIKQDQQVASGKGFSTGETMTPEQYAEAERKLERYGHDFDMSLDSKLPQPLAKTKAGKIVTTRV